MSQTLVPTVGLNVSKCDLNGIQCQFWDLGGGADLPKLWSKYYEEAHAVLFVIDSATVGEEERVRKLRKILGTKKSVKCSSCITLYTTHTHTNTAY